jgi:hypothetical protein
VEVSFRVQSVVHPAGSNQAVLFANLVSGSSLIQLAITPSVNFEVAEQTQGTNDYRMVAKRLMAGGQFTKVKLLLTPPSTLQVWVEDAELPLSSSLRLRHDGDHVLQVGVAYAATTTTAQFRLDDVSVR